ncbi:MAG TPA: hypothetical protein DCL15_18565 [Chloroflexi bacterium]|nr:hypothetical protein [Chloroflexota bacterium]HHW88596.1 DUF4432 family protein [Chloroflexota bacterium]
MPSFDLNQETLAQHSSDMRQFIDWRPATLDNGMRVLEGYNSSGLTLTLLPDRGLDIWLAAHNGRPLTWISQGAPHTADFGAGWLRLFNGGLLVTCGLRHVGPPETDARSGQFRDLHGDYSLLRAYNVAVQRGWRQEQYVAEVTGEIAEAALFGEQLHLTRTVRLVLGEPTVEIVDVVENRDDAPAPFMLLHHFNFGYPLVRAGVELHVASSAVMPRDLTAAAALHDWPHYHSATSRHLEEVFFHQVLTDVDRQAQVWLGSPTFGLLLEWDTTYEPYLTQWKNFRLGSYVCGVEPGNCVPEGQNRASRSGRLVQLAPGARHIFRNRLTVTDGAEAVAFARAHLDALRTRGQPVAIDLTDYAL